jgi:hypothetical protein
MVPISAAVQRWGYPVFQEWIPRYLKAFMLICSSANRFGVSAAESVATPTVEAREKEVSWHAA